MYTLEMSASVLMAVFDVNSLLWVRGFNVAMNILLYLQAKALQLTGDNEACSVSCV